MVYHIYWITFDHFSPQADVELNDGFVGVIKYLVRPLPPVWFFIKIITLTLDEELHSLRQERKTAGKIL